MNSDFPNYRKKRKSAALKPHDGSTDLDAYSPYLAALRRKYPDITGQEPEKTFSALLQATEKALSGKNASIEKILRDLKARCALLFGLADLSGAWDDMTVMRHLSLLADFCVTAALRHLLLQAHAQKKIKLANIKKPEDGSGVAVIALGKWGAFELNYSSDIDLMVIFDPARSIVADKDEVQNFFIRLTRDLARLIDQPTEDGYVFRTDLRLRPDPGAMPLAVSIGTAEIYYGSLGQNWERAAMIKSRVACGDGQTGDDFKRIMNAWIWRKNLDFAAIQDIHSIKRQINSKHAKPQKNKDPWAGYNVKLGHGGIREIEFFAQTQQLIFGGRDPSLRAPQTLAALRALCAAEHISAQDETALAAAYLFLRRIEHRLQMQDDRQTHSLPLQPDDFDTFARFAGYDDARKLADDLEKHTGIVKKLYARLFTDAPDLAVSGNLVFTGVEDDPETLDTLRGIGFTAPEKVTAAVRGWHHGRYRATRSERARQVLTEITPRLLSLLGATAHPDDAFLRFDVFLSRLPSGVPVFSLFAQSPKVMEIVASVMGSAPALADALGTHPQALDGILSRDFFGRLPDLEFLKQDIARHLKQARDYEDILDTARRWAREKRLHAGIHLLDNLSDNAATARYFSNIAEAALTALLPHVEDDFARQHGRFKSGEFIVLAMGSFAARHMYADSDLDIIGLYRCGAAEKSSNGAKPLPPNAYYIRLMQRLISALAAPTAEGVLYAVDTRLRPQGDAGPMAVQFDGFFDYQKNEAWVWEHMSLIRSRIVHAAPETAKEFDRRKKKILTIPRSASPLREEISDMRKRIAEKFGSKNKWDLKYAPGGLVDIMFLVHFLILSYAAEKPTALKADLGEGIAQLGKLKILAAKDATTLQDALDLAETAQGFLRLCAELPFVPDKAPAALLQRMALRCGDDSFESLTTRLETLRAKTMKIIQKHQHAIRRAKDSKTK